VVVGARAAVSSRPRTVSERTEPMPLRGRSWLTVG